MKTILATGAALALLCGVASAQTHLGASTNPNGQGANTTISTPEAQRMQRSNTTDKANKGTVGQSGMNKNDPAKAAPGGLAGSGGSNAGNMGGAAPGGSAGGGAGR